MSKVDKKEPLSNIKLLGEFESKTLSKFTRDFDGFIKETKTINSLIRNKKKALEEAKNSAYAEALQEMNSTEEKSETVEKADKTDKVETEKSPKAFNEKAKATKKVEDKKPVKSEAKPKTKATDKKSDKPEKKKTGKASIFEIKSRPKTKKEAELVKSRTFIPKGNKSRYTEDMPKSRRPQAGEVRNRNPFNKKPNEKPQFNNRNNQGGNNQGRPKPFKPAMASTFIPKENTRTKKKTDKKEPVKKGMDKRTLIRRGFIDTAPGAALDYDHVRHFKARKAKKNNNKSKAIKIEKAVLTSDIVPIKTLSEKMGVAGAQIIKKLFLLGIVKTINESIDYDTAELVATEFGVELELKAAKSSEEILLEHFDEAPIEENLITRSPVVTIMGHVDHGKTSLLDFIRDSKVTAGEAGGITQHIGAYTVTVDGDKITFLDTPGHEAFTSMRLRGAQATDIAVIVVAADDGIMPQTIEAIAHAKASGVNIIVAINKMDKVGANPERVKQQLTEHELLPEEWGGETICVPVSAHTGEGVDKLLESINLVAEVSELKADPEANAKGIIIEAQLDKGRGPVATVLVQNGTLKTSNFIVAGTSYGKVRAMMDDKGKIIKSAGPSTPVQIQGFNDVPQAGDIMMVVNNEKLAKKVIEDRKDEIKMKQNMNKSGTSLEDMFKTIAEGEMKNLNVIIKGDVQGSVEAIKQEVLKLSNEEVKVNVIQCSVGAVKESDVMLADSSGSIIIAFNVRPDSKSKKMAERNNIDIRVYRVIYDIINDLNLALKGMLEPKFEEVIMGRAEVRSVFKLSSSGTIAGCYVIEDKIVRNAKVRLLRDNVIVTEGSISSLKRFKDDVKEVKEGFECGISIEGYNDIKEGDIIENYIMQEIKA